jgi:DNA invertase Pin-like site-specific DNA recombinase
MMNDEILPPALLKRKAVVYIRQSTQLQVQVNLESQRRQYELVDEARRRGFREVEVIDDDLSRSASGAVARPGFEKLVAWLCAGDVGAVLCFDASRLARNGRDWHHLLELCGLVEARVIDLDGVYNPCRPNDRLLLGMKGSISEFELGVLRARMYDAARSKARRGELRISVPIGYIWHREIGLGLDPDARVQEATALIFSRFRLLGSARQVHLSLKAEGVHFPRPSDGKKMVSFEWAPIRYRNVISVLKKWPAPVPLIATEIEGSALKTAVHHVEGDSPRLTAVSLAYARAAGAASDLYAELARLRTACTRLGQHCAARTSIGRWRSSSSRTPSRRRPARPRAIAAAGACSSGWCCSAPHASSPAARPSGSTGFNPWDGGRGSRNG